MALLALLDLGNLAGNLVVRFLSVNLLDLLLEGIEFLTDCLLYTSPSPRD